MKIILSGLEAKQKVKDGIDKTVNLAKLTLGAAGHSILIEQQYGSPEFTDDGVAVINATEFEDKFEQMGRDLILDVAHKTNEKVGDGTTTSSILTQAIIEGYFPHLELYGGKSMEIKRGIQEGVKQAIAVLSAGKKDVTTAEQIEQVAFISSLDEEAARVIREIVDAVGRNGLITVEDGITGKLEKEVVQGMKIDKGYLSPYFITNVARMEAVSENPVVLVTENRVTFKEEIIPVLQALVNDGKKDLVIFGDVEGEALETCIDYKLKGVFNTLVVQVPSVGDKRLERLEDIAAVVGTTVISPTNKFSGVEQLGTAHRVIATKESTVIVGVIEKTLKPRQEVIQLEIDNAKTEFEKQTLKQRLANLTGSVGVIKVGAATEIELRARKFKIEDALNATRAAIEEGVVAGGGIALDEIIVTPFGSPAERIGMAAVGLALHAPLTQIALNLGIKREALIETIKASPDILDPFKVVRVALENAASVAAELAVAEGAIAIKREEKK